MSSPWDPEHPQLPRRAAFAGSLALALAGVIAVIVVVQANGPAAGSSVLNAIVEPEHALVQDFGPEWHQTDKWFVEDTVPTSGCAEFDQVGLPQSEGHLVTVWHDGSSHLTLSTYDSGYRAAEYVATFRNLPVTCPTVQIGSSSVTVEALEDASVEGVAAVELSAYPLPVSASDPSEVWIDSTAWAATLSRDNVVSVITVESNGELTIEDFGALVATAREALDSAPIEAKGPFVAGPTPTPIPPIQPGIVTDVKLKFLNTRECRDKAETEAAGITWVLRQLPPIDWRGRNNIAGDLTIRGEDATFVSRDGVSLEMQAVFSDFRKLSCTLWD